MKSVIYFLAAWLVSSPFIPAAFAAPADSTIRGRSVGVDLNISLTAVAPPGGGGVSATLQALAGMTVPLYHEDGQYYKHYEVRFSASGDSATVWRMQGAWTLVGVLTPAQPKMLLREGYASGIEIKSGGIRTYGICRQYDYNHNPKFCRESGGGLTTTERLKAGLGFRYDSDLDSSTVSM